ncbi:acetolactate synthase large subunit [Amycolatopsis sp. lyj-23]|uniref:acetolactate synthase large subunit n=1 Tax=Amycolatopsis sp. lyj-23 TaxID=2789283 RepID=UPI003979917D
MNGAAALLGSLRAAGLTVCFANPGTSELHLVAALDSTPGVRGVLCLFEGVATGAADGYARMAGQPAATLLHQGPGLANGLANLHNAQRARTPVVSLVGASTTEHRALDAPLESDVAAVAAPFSRWVRMAEAARTIGEDAVAAVRAAQRAPHGVATLIVPSDVAWAEGARMAEPGPAPSAPPVPAGELGRVADLLRRGAAVTLLLGGAALRHDGLAAAAKIGAATGIRVMAETFPARLERGIGVAPVERLAADVERARRQLSGTGRLVLVDSVPPVAAFGSPGARGELTPPGCVVDRLGAPGEDVAAALEELAGVLAPGVRAHPAAPLVRSKPLTGSRFTLASIGKVIAAQLPEGAVVVDEANTSGPDLVSALEAAPRHDLLSLCGFAIGEGLPLSIGAALACPARPVICLQADGSAMYSISALWTQARERLDVTTLVLNNRGYAILRAAERRLRDGNPGSSPLFDVADPELDFVAISTGMGVPAARARTADELGDHLAWAMAEAGPHLIEVVLAGEDPR